MPKQHGGPGWRLCALAAGSLRALAGIEDGDGVVAAVSGGADSVALLSLLQEASWNGLLRLRITVAHLHHGIRGETADRDLEFVRGLASTLELPFVGGRADVPALSAAGGQGVEAAARMARYSFLAGVARDTKSRAVATGHTQDDQAETILHRMIRGAGSRGLAGIIPSRPICTDPTVLLVRPLLNVSREEILEYLRLKGRDFRDDETNLDLRYTRNRVRLELMPLLCKINPGAKTHLAALAAEFAQARTGPLAPPAAAPREGDRLLRPAAGRSSDEFARDARAAYEAAGGDPGCLERRHFKALGELLDDPEGDASTNLPRGFTAVRTGDQVMVVPPRPRSDACISATPLPLNGTACAGRYVVDARGPLDPSAARTGSQDGTAEFLDLDRVELPLAVRGRRDGDRFHPLGGPGRMRLKEFLRAAGIPAQRRDQVPLVVDARDRILWVVPYRICEWAKVGGSTGKVLELKADRR